MVEITVVIPTYNMRNFLHEAIDSVLSQTYQDFELVVVDDGSTDDTARILGGYGARIRVLRQRNQGGASALNAGIRIAQGEWIAWLSADDAWEPTKLESQVQDLKARNVGLSYTDYFYMDESGRVLSKETQPLPSSRTKVLLRLCRRCFVNGSTTLIRRDVFDRVGYFDEGDRYTPDWDMWFRIAQFFDFSYVDKPLVRYRIHGAQTSAKSDLMERSSRRTLAVNVRRLGPGLGAIAASLAFLVQIRHFPAFIRESAGHGRSAREQVVDLLEWLAILVDPQTKRLARQ